jgi:hypothetical protein
VFGSYLTGTYHARNLMAAWGMSASYFDHIPYYGGESPAPNILTALKQTIFWPGSGTVNCSTPHGRRIRLASCATATRTPTT